MALKLVTSKLPRIQLPQLPEKFKGTVVERWVKYWKGLASDYKDVGLDTVNWIKTNPRRSAVYGAIGGFLYTSGKTNPNQNDFNEQIKKCEQLVALVPVDMHNPVTVDYLKNLERNQNLGTLRISSIGLFSIMWINDFAKDLATFDATCEYLKPEWKTFHQRIVDIGFLGNWWNLDRQLRDYDINY